MLKKINVKSKWSNAPVSNFRKNKFINTQILKTLNFDELDISNLNFRWFDEVSKESFHCQEHQFINFLRCNEPENKDCEVTHSDANIFIRSLKNINRLKNNDKIQRVRNCINNDRVKSLFLYSAHLTDEIFEYDLIYKVHPLVINKKIGSRVFCCIMTDDSNIESVGLYLGVFLIDLYHLVFPSAYKYGDNREYKKIFYNAFKDSNINIYDRLNG